MSKTGKRTTGKKSRGGGKMDSVKKKIQKMVILLVSISLLILGVISCVLNYSSTISSLKQNMREMAVIASDRVEWEITAFKNIVQELGRTARLSNADYTTEQKQDIIDEKVEAYNLIRGKLIDPDGIARIDGTDYSEREYFQRAMKGETYISEPLIAKTDGSLSLIFAAPVWEEGIPDTNVVGVVFLSMKPDLLNDIVKSIYISDNSGAYIINAKGKTVAHTTEGMVEAGHNNIELAQTDSSYSALAAIEEKMVAGETGVGSYRYEGVSKFSGYAPIGNTDGWSLAITTPVSDFLGDTIFGIIMTAIVVAVFLAIASVLAVKIGTSIGEPIRQCSERLTLIVNGDLKSPVPDTDLQDEVGVLTRATKEITESLNSIINDIRHMLGEMSGGDFTVITEVEEKYVGDYQEILTAVNGIQKRLGTTLASIQEASGQVTIGSNQLAENAQSLAEGATEQAGAVEELTATISNVTNLSRQSAENAETAYKQVDESVEKAKAGERAMTDLAEAMERITATSQEIQNIITAIEDIASQTNLLSLNASIEAARAGEAGRGFAVVAEQIGKLATDSAQSANDTRELIIKVLEEIERGNKLTGTTTEVFNEVVESMNQFAELTRNTSSASEQQAQMLEQIEQGVEQISSVVQSNSASAEETSATSEELSAQAENMNELVSGIKF